MEEYEEEFTQLANFTKNDANISIGWIGNYKINNGTVDGEFNYEILLNSRNIYYSLGFLYIPVLIQLYRILRNTILDELTLIQLNRFPGNRNHFYVHSCVMGNEV